MIGAGIEEGDILVIDKSLDPMDSDIAVCFLDGEFTVISGSRSWVGTGLFLMPAIDEFTSIRIAEERESLVWGIETYVIHKAR